MTSTLVVLIGLVVIVFLVVIVVVSMYNRLVALRNRYKNAFSQIDVQLKRRYDLIPTWSRPPRATSSTSGRRWRR